MGEIPKAVNRKNANTIMKFASEIQILDGVEQKKSYLGIQTKTIAWLNIKPITFFAGFVEIDNFIYPCTGYQRIKNNKEESKIFIIK